MMAAADGTGSEMPHLSDSRAGTLTGVGLK